MPHLTVNEAKDNEDLYVYSAMTEPEICMSAGMIGLDCSSWVHLFLVFWRLFSWQLYHLQ